MAASRSWPVPDSQNLIHFIGDPHCGAAGISAVRLAKMQADLNNGPWCPTPVHRVVVGDQADAGLSSEDTTCQTWLAGITDGAPYDVIAGNHDLWHNVRTIADWMAAWGYTTQNYIKDLDFCRLVFLNPDSVPYPSNSNDSTSILLSQATLDWLDARLGETAKDCVVVCHAPLYNTVAGGAGQFQSTDAKYFIAQTTADADSAAVTAVLADHANAKAWISGHTHTSLSVGLTNTLSIGGHNVACVNCSSPFYNSRTSSPDNQILSVYVNYYPGDRVEVRYRSHGGGVYNGTGFTRVNTLDIST